MTRTGASKHLKVGSLGSGPSSPRGMLCLDVAKNCSVGLLLAHRVWRALLLMTRGTSKPPQRPRAQQGSPSGETCLGGLMTGSGMRACCACHSVDSSASARFFRCHPERWPSCFLFLYTASGRRLVLYRGPITLLMEKRMKFLNSYRALVACFRPGCSTRAAAIGFPRYRGFRHQARSGMTRAVFSCGLEEIPACAKFHHSLMVAAMRGRAKPPSRCVTGLGLP